MSNLSNIGFNVSSEKEFEKLAEKACEKGKEIKVKGGSYICYKDNSGAELWMQVNPENEITGLNPHFKGKSRRNVCLTSVVTYEESELDGAYYSWADPMESNKPESGAYPFVFDVPDFLRDQKTTFPLDIEIQLTAFAQELQYFENEEAFSNDQEEGFKWASKSFMSTGLFKQDEKEEAGNPEAYGMFAGEIQECKRIKNKITGQYFYWMLVDTLGGEIDVVADPRSLEKEPSAGGIIHGNFWLSGQILQKSHHKTDDEKVIPGFKSNLK